MASSRKVQEWIEAQAELDRIRRRRWTHSLVRNTFLIFFGLVLISMSGYVLYTVIPDPSNVSSTQCTTTSSTAYDFVPSTTQPAVVDKVAQTSTEDVECKEKSIPSWLITIFGVVLGLLIAPELISLGGKVYIQGPGFGVTIDQSESRPAISESKKNIDRDSRSFRNRSGRAREL